MRIVAIFLCTILLTFSATATLALTENTQFSAAPNPLYSIESETSFFVQDHGLNGITLEVVLPPAANRISTQGLFASQQNESTHSPMPYISRWVVIPENVDVNLHITRQEGRRLRAEPQFGTATYIDDWDISITETENFRDLPAVSAFVGRPARLRGIPMVPVIIHPVQKLDDSGKAFENHQITIELEFTADEDMFPGISYRAPYSPEFSEILENLVVNPPARDLAPVSRSRILILHNARLGEEEDMINDINSFAEWKRRLGYNVEVLPVEISEDYEQRLADQEDLKERIREYYVDEMSLEFLMIMGDYDVFSFGADSIDHPIDEPYFFPTFIGELPNEEEVNVEHKGDQFYVTFDDGDILPDVIVGRFICSNYEDLSYALTRIIQYEQNPVDGDWYTRAVYSAATDVNEGGAVPPSFLALDVIQWTERRLQELGYREVNCIIDRDFPDIGEDVQPLLEEGVSLALSETWLCGSVLYEVVGDEEFRMTGIANTGRRHPFVITNHAHYHDPILIPFFNSGSVDEPSGPVSAYGMWKYPYDMHVSHIIGWSIWAMQNLNLFTSGYLFQFAGMQLSSIIDYSIPDEAYRYEFMGFYRFLGDPTVKIRTAQPTQQLAVSHPESFNIGATLVNLIVTSGDDPVNNAIVCIRQGEDMQFVAMSDAEGNVQFTVPDGLQEGELQITASKHNHIPYVQSPAVGEQAVNIVLLSQQLINGEFENGRIVELRLEFANNGEDNAENLTASFSSDNEYLDFNPNSVGIAQIEAGQISGLDEELLLFLNPDCPGGILTQVRIDVSDGEAHWLSAFEVTTSGPRLEVEEVNSQLQIGRVGTLSAVLANTGDRNSAALNAELTTSDPYVTVTVPNRNYPEINADETAEPDSPCSVRVSELFFPGSMIDFELILSDGENYDAVVPFQVGPIGEVSPGDPLGPDNHGYICFDSRDEEWEDHPVYNWIEISSDAVDAIIPGTKIEFEINDRPPPDVWSSTEVIELPFPFRYYGQEYNSISVCTNGWLALGADGVENRSPEDWQLSGPGGADAMVDVYHTDLEASDPAISGVYYHYIEGENLFIVEWFNLDFANRTDLEQHLTFQAILYDPSVYTTPSEDGEIVFQYKVFGEMEALREADSPPSFGIRNSDGSDGLQYYYKFDFPPQAIQPENEFALKFTTAVQTGKGSISGRIVQMSDPEVGVPGATIDLLRIEEIVTDDEGNFRFENLREGQYTATINALGYSRIEQDINVVGGEDMVIDPILLPAPMPHVEVIPMEIEVRPDSSRTRADVLLENRGTGTLEYTAEIRYQDGRAIDYRSISEFSINEIFGIEGHTRGFAPLYVAEQDLLYIPATNGDQKVIGVFNLNGELQRTIQQPMVDEEEEFKSLGWDGERLWGSIDSFADQARMLLQLNDQGELSDTIIVPFNFYRALPFVFSPGGETIYVTESEEDLLEMDREGNVLETWQISFPGRLTEVTGLGYNPYDLDGMPLYMIEIGEEDGVDTVLRYIKFDPESENGDWKIGYEIQAAGENGDGDDAVGLRTTYGATVIPAGYEGETVSFGVVQTYGRSREANDMFVEREISPNVAFMVPGSIEDMSGEIEPGGRVSLGFEVEGNGWPEGQYHWSYVISHNALGDDIVVPVILTLDMESGSGQNNPGSPTEFGLHSIYPNPFNNITRITFGIEQSSPAFVGIFDLTGRLIETLFEGTAEIGEHSITWDADNIPSGVYLVQLQSGVNAQSKKVVLLK